MTSNDNKLSIPQFYSEGIGSANADLLGLSRDSTSRVIFERAEKLRAAFILVAQNLDYADKTVLLNLANELIYIVIDMVTGNISRSVFLRKAKSILAKLNELMDAFYLNSLLSEQNIGILKRGITSFAHNMQNIDTELASGSATLREEDLLSLPDNLKNLNADDDTVSQQKNYKGQNKGQNKGHINRVNKLKPGKRANKTIPSRHRSVKEVSERHSRRIQILDILKNTPWLTTTEIANKLPQKISPKTLQRELKSMLNEGVIIKEGELRWTRYMTA